MHGDEIGLKFSISKESAERILNGSARLESGGVRDLGGKILELAKPVVSSALEEALSPVTLVSSLGNNIQSVFIQKGVNKANKKMDLSLEMQEEILNRVRKISNTDAVNMVNCVLGMSDCMISVAGFYLVFQKLEGIENEICEISKKIDKIDEHIKEKEQGDLLEKFNTFCGYIYSDIDSLENKNIKVSERENIPDHLSEIDSYLKRVITEFENGKINEKLACHIIFGLLFIFAKEITIYSSRYYYECGRYPAYYENWKKTIEIVNGNEFRDTFRCFLSLSQIPTVEKYKTFTGIMGAVELQLGNMEYERKMVERLGYKDYLNVNQYLTDKVRNRNEWVIRKEKVYIEV